jgi:hypothetical protein
MNIRVGSGNSVKETYPGLAWLAEELNAGLKQGRVVRRQEGQEKKKRLTVVVLDFEWTRTTNHQTQYSVAVGAAARTSQFLVAEAGLNPRMCHSQMRTLAEGDFLNSTNFLQRRGFLQLQVAGQQSSQKGQHCRSGSIDLHLVAVAASGQGSQREIE